MKVLQAWTMPWKVHSKSNWEWIKRGESFMVRAAHAKTTLSITWVLVFARVRPMNRKEQPLRWPVWAKSTQTALLWCSTTNLRKKVIEKKNLLPFLTLTMIRAARRVSSTILSSLKTWWSRWKTRLQEHQVHLQLTLQFHRMTKLELHQPPYLLVCNRMLHR